MYNLQAPFDATRSISALEIFSALANSALTAAGRLTALNLNTTLDILENSLTMGATLADVKGLQDLGNMNHKFRQPAIDKLAEYSRNLVEIARQSGEEVAEILHAENGKISASIPAALRKAA